MTRNSAGLKRRNCPGWCEARVCWRAARFPDDIARMRTNHVRAKLKRGEPTIGTWLSLPDPMAAQLMARIGFDWLTLNLEHSPIGIETMAMSFSVICAQGPAPLARIVSNTGENIKRVLDNGGWGVVVPMVNTREEAQAAVAATRYAPLGDRSVGGLLHAANFDTDPATYYEKANDEVLLIVQMEHVKAIENAEEILSVPGIDAFFIGPNDLLSSMGKKPMFDTDDPQFVHALKHLIEVGKKHGVAPGIHAADAAMVKKRVDQGFQFVAVASEAGMMLSKAGEIAKSLGLGAGKTVAKY
jgi:4-hydroxy-2-oxoheptanedioate aldolase